MRANVSTVQIQKTDKNHNINISKLRIVVWRWLYLVYRKLISFCEMLDQMAEQKRVPENMDSKSNSERERLKNLPGGKIYASNGPRIMLEIITARTAAIIIALTWVVFIICFSIDFYITYKSFHSSNYALSAVDCSSFNLTETENIPQFGCSNGADGNWNATIQDLSNVISFSMDVQQVNMSSLVANRTSNIFTFGYNLQVWTCYNSKGCGNSFDFSSTYTNDKNIWQKVLTLQDATIDVDLGTALVSDGAGDKKISLQLITNTFQNQESIPTNGLVKSYFVTVEYTNNPFGLFASESNVQQEDTTYNFHVVRAPGNSVLAGINVVLLIITLAVLGTYCYILYKNIGSLSRWKRALSEQKWVIMYFFLVILFQNPVYCVIYWYTGQPPVTAAYAAFLINYIAQSGLFTLWLLFAHSYQRKLQRKTFFYGPKVFIGVTIFVFGVFILTYQFPSLALPKTDRSSVEAVENWTKTLKLSFVVCTIIYLSLIMFWTIVWFVRLVLTGRMMNRLPYMSTRYMQLSFRFFSLQATLVTIYYIAQYILVAYFISRDTTTGYATSLSVIADNINVLFRQQFQLFGKTFFLTTYAMVLAFMFLPPDLLDSTGFYTTIASTYAISEEEHKEVVHGRKIALKSVRRNLINQVTRYDQLIRAKDDVFCVDLALKMRNISFQAYYDRKDGAQTASSFGKTQNIGKLGFELIEEFYDPTHEVYCIIARETINNKDDKNESRIVVAFRGTASKRQMEDNMNYSQRPVDFDNLDIPSLDHLDRLTVPLVNDPAMDIELESVDGDDLEEATPLTSLPPSFFQRILQQFNTLAANNGTNAVNNTNVSPVKAANANNNDNISLLSRGSFFRAPSLSLFARTNVASPPATALTSASTVPMINTTDNNNNSHNGTLSLQSNSSRTSVLQRMTPSEEEVAIKVLGLRKHHLHHSHGHNSINNNIYAANNINNSSDMNDVQRSSSVSHHRISLARESVGNAECDLVESALDNNSAGGYRSHKILSDDISNTNNTNGGGFGALMGRETIMLRAGQMGGNITNFLSDAVGATNQGIDLVVGATTGAMQTAAKHTPGLKKFVTPNVHAGFWEAYTVVRGFLHGVLRAELMKNPCNVIFTGHSLGGALASFAALDFKLTSLPRINAYLKYQAKKELLKLQQMELNASNYASYNAFSNRINTTNVADDNSNVHNMLFNPPTTAALRAALFPSLLPVFSRKNRFKNTNNNHINNQEDGLDTNYALLDDEHDIERPSEILSSNYNSSPTNNTSNNNNNSGGILPRFQLFRNNDNNIANNTGVSPVQSSDGQPVTSNDNNNTGWSHFLSSQNSQHLHQAVQSTLNIGNAPLLSHEAVFVKKIDVIMYNFGSPRVGNFSFQQLYNKEIPRSYRIVVDGDLVAALPPSGYRHIGTQILIDSVGAGTIIIDPSFVERWLRTHMKSSISVHSLLCYQKGLLGVKLSAEEMRKYASEKQIEDIDPTRLALAWRHRVQIEKIVESETAEPPANTDDTADEHADDLEAGRRSSFFSGVRRLSHTAAAAVASVTSTTSTFATSIAPVSSSVPSAMNTPSANTRTSLSSKLPWSLTLTHPQGQSDPSPVDKETHVHYSPMQSPQNHKDFCKNDDDAVTFKDDTISADSNNIIVHVNAIEVNGELNPEGIDASNDASNNTIVDTSERHPSEQSHVSEEGISLSTVSCTSKDAMAESSSSFPYAKSDSAKYISTDVFDSTVSATSSADRPVSITTHLRKKAIGVLEGSQEEEYYDHTEKDYEALMGQIRHWKKREKWHNKMKMVPTLLGLHNTKKRASATTDIGSGTNDPVNTFNEDKTSLSQIKPKEYVPPEVRTSLEDAAEEKKN